MTEDSIVAACEQVWQRVTQSCEPKYSVSHKRTPQGSYVCGYRDDIQEWRTEIAGYVVMAKQIGWQTFDVSADKEGTKRSLDVRVLDASKDGHRVWFAIQEGPTKIISFEGSDEKYTGTSETPADPWRVVDGAIPEELIAADRASGRSSAA